MRLAYGLLLIVAFYCSGTMGKDRLLGYLFLTVGLCIVSRLLTVRKAYRGRAICRASLASEEIGKAFAFEQM